MVAVTYGVARVPAVESAKGIKSIERADCAAPRKSWFARLLDAMIEARMQQAQREIKMHLHLLPYSLDERGNRLVKPGANDMPFAQND
jgi:hypothetical protein